MNNQEVIELSLEKVIETKLVQANVTDMVLTELKEKYGNLKLKALDDKESYLELKAAAKVCAKVRTLAVKICKDGREEAVKAQKEWIKKEKEVVGKVAEVEDALDAEVALYDAEVERIATEEKNRQEEAYINRQAVLTKMGATYTNGSFELGDASFEANLIKGASQNIWDEDIVPKFALEYEKIEAVRIAEQKKKAEEEAAIKAEQEKLKAEQEAFRLQQEEFNRKQAEVLRLENEKIAAAKREQDRIEREAEFERMKIAAAEAAEAKRIADIELAVKKEKERQEVEALRAEEKRREDEFRKAEQLAQSSDKVKWEEFISQVKEMKTFEMRSGQYRRKMQVAKEKLEEILSL